MKMLDLDVIAKKKRKIRLNGKEVPFRNLTVEEHLLGEFEVKEIEEVPLVSKKDIQKASQMMANYLQKILEITPEDAKQVTFDQFKALRQYMTRADLYDQGFSDEEINKLEKLAVKKQINSGE